MICTQCYEFSQILIFFYVSVNALTKFKLMPFITLRNKNFNLHDKLIFEDHIIIFSNAVRYTRNFK